MHTRFLAFPKKLFEKFTLPPIPTRNSQMHLLNWKMFPNEKIFSLIWTKGTEMHTHFWDFLRKIFILWKALLTYLELQSQMTPYFPEKMRKYFFGCGCFSLLVPKNPFTYSHRERSNAHPEAQKILPLHLFGIERSKRTLFFRKQAKNLPANTGGHKKIPTGALPMGKKICCYLLSAC